MIGFKYQPKLSLIRLSLYIIVIACCLLLMVLSVWVVKCLRATLSLSLSLSFSLSFTLFLCMCVTFRVHTIFEIGVDCLQWIMYRRRFPKHPVMLLILTLRWIKRRARLPHFTRSLFLTVARPNNSLTHSLTDTPKNDAFVYTGRILNDSSLSCMFSSDINGHKSYFIYLYTNNKKGFLGRYVRDKCI